MAIYKGPSGPPEIPAEPNVTFQSRRFVKARAEAAKGRDVIAANRRINLGFRATDTDVPRDVRAADVRAARKRLLAEERANVQRRRDLGLAQGRGIDPDTGRGLSAQVSNRATVKFNISQQIRSETTQRNLSRAVEAKRTRALTVEAAILEQGEQGGTGFERRTSRTLSAPQV